MCQTKPGGSGPDFIEPRLDQDFPQVDFYQTVTDMRGGNIIKFDIVKQNLFL